MFKNILKAVENVAGKEFHLFCDAEITVDHLKEFGYRILKFAGQVEEQIKAQQEAQKAQEEAQKPPEAVPEAKPAE